LASRPFERYSSRFGQTFAAGNCPVAVGQQKRMFFGSPQLPPYPTAAGHRAIFRKNLVAQSVAHVHSGRKIFHLAIGNADVSPSECVQNNKEKPAGRRPCRLNTVAFCPQKTLDSGAGEGDFFRKPSTPDLAKVVPLNHSEPNNPHSKRLAGRGGGGDSLTGKTRPRLCQCGPLLMQTARAPKFLRIEP